ncbi:sigma-70 family RNA polymerase sigma factor [Streptomyces sp. NPDC001941]|uniref:RNA polymerase sigma factor n=1 Tax=Streptomyces sp. NPDC001941 TaxID=3154659 RepID=UPI0033233D41
MASDEGEPPFERLYRETCRRMLAKGIVVCGGDVALAQDAVQEAYVICWRRMNSGQRVENWKAWLAVVVVRECLRALRGAPGTYPLADLEVAAREPEFAEHLDLKDAYRRVCGAIVELSDRQRSAVALCCLADLGAREAGRIMGIEAPTVRVHLTRARQALRPLWEELRELGVLEDRWGGEA